MIYWGLSETYGLSERMTYRVAKRLYFNTYFKKKNRLSASEIRKIAFGDDNPERPDWFPSKEAVTGVEDTWDDWTEDEKETLKARLRAGINSGRLYHVFKVSDKLAAELNDEVFGSETVGVPWDEDEANETPVIEDIVLERTIVTEKAKYEKGEFREVHIEDVEYRRFANRRWEEYGERVDLDKPANQTSVRMIIFLEVELNKAMREANSQDRKLRREAASRVSEINKDFSKIAADLAQLEKQFKIEREYETLDAVIIRTHDIRKGWRDREIENLMGLHNVYDLYEQEHKIRLGGEDEGAERIEPVEIPEPEFSQKRDVAKEFAIRALQESEKTEETIVAEGV